MADPYAGYKPSLDSPPDRQETITGNDSADLSTKYKCIICTSAGDVPIICAEGNTITYAMTVNQILPFRPTRIKLTGLTATVVGWWDE